MAILVVRNVEVVVRTRGEHCPPHVHADCPSDGWDSRFVFTFLNDDVIYWDTVYRRKKPSKALLNRIGVAIHAHLPACRERWWQARQTTCLENRYVCFIGRTMSFCSRAAEGASKVVSATYDPGTRTVTVLLADNAVHTQTL